MTAVAPGAGLRSLSSVRCRVASAAASALRAAFTCVAAVFFAGFGTIRWPSGVTA